MSSAKALHEAIRRNDLLQAQRIWARGPTTTLLTQANDEGRTPLHSACELGNQAAVSWILSIAQDARYSIDLEAVDMCFMTPLHVACNRGHLQVAGLLLNAGVSVHATTPEGNTALHYLARIKPHPESDLVLLEVFQLVISRARQTDANALMQEANPIYAPNGGAAALASTTATNTTTATTTAATITTAPKKPNALATLLGPNVFGDTPLHLACAAGNTTSVAVLLQYCGVEHFSSQNRYRTNQPTNQATNQSINHMLHKHQAPTCCMCEIYRVRLFILVTCNSTYALSGTHTHTHSIYLSNPSCILTNLMNCAFEWHVVLSCCM